MNFNKRLLALGCLVLSINGNAQNIIDHTGWYVGGAIGSSKSKMEIDNFSSSENTLGHQIYGGYNFNKWFGIEGNFFLSGDVSDNEPGVRDAYFAGFSIAPKINIQVTPQLAFFAKAGLAQLAYTEEYSRRYYEDNYDDYYRFDRRQSWTDQVSNISVGAEWSIADKLKLRVVYDYLSGSIEEDDYDYYDYYLDEIDVTLKNISCGIHYQF